MGKNKDHQPLGYINDLSPDQSSCLQQFRDHITLKHPLLDQNIEDDWQLLRFCRARKFNLKSVILMHDNYVEFSRQHDIYNMLSADEPEIIQGLYEAYPQGIYGTSKSGHPVCIEVWGGINHGDILKNYTQDQVIRHFLRWCMKMIHAVFYKCSEKNGKPCDGFYLIIDFKVYIFTFLFFSGFLLDFYWIFFNFFMEIMKNLRLKNFVLIF